MGSSKFYIPIILIAMTTSAHGELPLKPLSNEEATKLLSGNGYAACEETTIDALGKSVRTPEQIRCIFDKNGMTLNPFYQSALKESSHIDGTIRVKLVIEPNGTVSSIDIVTSTISHKSLEKSIVNGVKGFKFPDQNVAQWIGTYDLNFHSHFGLERKL